MLRWLKQKLVAFNTHIFEMKIGFFCFRNSITRLSSKNWNYNGTMYNMIFFLRKKKRSKYVGWNRIKPIRKHKSLFVAYWNISDENRMKTKKNETAKKPKTMEYSEIRIFLFRIKFVYLVLSGSLCGCVVTFYGNLSILLNLLMLIMMTFSFFSLSPSFHTLYQSSSTMNCLRRTIKTN